MSEQPRPSRTSSSTSAATPLARKGNDGYELSSTTSKSPSPGPSTPRKRETQALPVDNGESARTSRSIRTHLEKDLELKLLQVQATVDGQALQIGSLDGRVKRLEPSKQDIPNTFGEAFSRIMTERWFNPVIGLFAALNVTLWGSLMWLVFKIDLADRNPSCYWLVAILVVFFVGGLVLALLVAAILAFIAWKSTKNRVLHAIATEWSPAISILFIELAPLIIVPVYIAFAAQRWYSAPAWELDTGFSPEIPSPAFALFGDYNDAASAHLTQDWTKCYFPGWSPDNATSCHNMFPNDPNTTEHSPYGKVTFYNFSPLQNGASNVNFTSPTQELLLQTTVQWDSAKLRDTYDTKAPQNPSLYAILYDSRLTIDDLKVALTCGILGWTEQPALGSTTYTIHETLHTIDERNLLDAPSDDAACKTLTNKLYKELDKGYRTYRYHVTSSGTASGSVCDRNGTGTVAPSCVSQVLVRFGSFGETTVKSFHKYEKPQMLVDVAAIVGAIAYVGWFLTIYK